MTPLTSRELNVLELVATGLTNREIAERLSVSRRTIDAHLRSIYGKIGVASRSAATRYALEHGVYRRHPPLFYRFASYHVTGPNRTASQSTTSNSRSWLWES